MNLIVGTLFILWFQKSSAFQEFQCYYGERITEVTCTCDPCDKTVRINFKYISLFIFGGDFNMKEGLVSLKTLKLFIVSLIIRSTDNATPTYAKSPEITLPDEIFQVHLT